MKRSLVAALAVLLASPLAARAGVGDVVGGFIRFSDGVADDTYTIGAQPGEIGILHGAANVSAAVRETIGPFTVTARGGDTVSVRLQEVLPNGGFFRIVQVDGVAASFFSLSDTIGRVYADRTLFVGSGDTFNFLYTSAAGGDTLADTAVVVANPSTGVITFVQGAFSSTTTPPFYQTRENQNLSSFADTLFVRVVDADANRNPLGRDTVLVAIRNLVTNDSEHLTLIETTDTSGIFTCTNTVPRNDTLVGSTTGGAGNNNGRLDVFFDGNTPEDTITVTYRDPVNNDFAQDTNHLAFPVSATGLFARAAGDTEADSGTIPGRAYPLVIDADQNANAALIETVAVTVTSSLTGDSERITLTEIGVNFGVFFYDTGLILSDTEGRNIAGDNKILTARNDTLTFRYTDPDNSFDTATDTIPVRRLGATATVQVLGDTFHFSVSPDTRAVGETIALGVIDEDRNDSPLASESIVVRLFVARTGDYETVTLSERFPGAPGVLSDTSGTFLSRGFSLYISDTIGATANDSALFAAGGDTIELSYNDSGTTRIDSITVTRLPSSSNTIFFSLTTGGIIETIPVRSSLTVRVNDPDQNRNVTVADSLTVTLSSFSGGSTLDTVTIRLFETGVTSGVFVNSTDTVFLSDTYGLAATDTRILLVRVGDTVFVSYLDPITATDSSTDSIAIVTFDSRPSVVTLVDTSFAVAPDSFAVADSVLAVVVTDLNRNANPQGRDSFVVQVIVSATGDSVTLVLLETSDTSGVFRSFDSVTISDTRGIVAGDSILFASHGDTLFVTYADSNVAADSALDTANIRRNSVAGTTTIFLTNAFTTTGTFAPDSIAYVRVIDPNLNRRVGTAESYAVVLRSLRTGDTVSIFVTEQSVADTSFVGSVFVSDTPAASFSDTVLSCASNDSIAVRYVDPFFAEVVEDTRPFSTFSLAGTISFSLGAVTALGTGADTFFHGDSLFVRVFDRDRNTSPSLRDSVQVTIFSYTSSGTTLDSVTLILGEVRATDSTTADSASGAFANADTPIRVTILDAATAGDTNLAIDPVLGKIDVVLSATAPDNAFDTAASVSIVGTISFRRGAASGAQSENFTHGDSLFVRVMDLDRSSYATVRDSLQVTVYSLSSTGDTIDSVILRLHEVSTADSRTASSSSGAFSNGDTPIRLSITDFPVAGDTTLSVAADSGQIRVQLSLSSPDTAIDTGFVVFPGVNATLAIVDSSFASSDTFRIGDFVHATIVDSDLNRNPSVRDSITLTFLATSDNALVVLVETTETSGIFRSAADSTLLSADTGTTSPDVLFVGPGETFSVSYFDTQGLMSLLVDSVNVTVPFTPVDTISIVDTTGFRVARVRLGDTLGIEIFGPNLRNLTTLFDTVSVLVRTARDSEYLSAVETTTAGRVFRNFAGILVTAESHPHHGDGRIAVAAGDTIQVTLVTLATTARDTVFVDSVAVTVETGYFRDTGGTQIDSKNIGLSFVPVLRDTGINVSPFVRDTFTLTLTTAALRDSVTIRFTELTESSSIFLGDTVALVQDGAGYDPTDTRLEVIGGDTVFMILDGVTFRLGVLATSATGALTADSRDVVVNGLFGPGDTLNATVFDPDENKDPLSADSVIVTIRSAFDTVTLRLVERATDTSFFRNSTGCSITLRSALVPSTTDSFLEVIDGETVTVSYVDVDDPSDSGSASFFVRLTPTTSTCTASKTVSSQAAAGSALLGETLFVWVHDPNANKDGAVRDTFSVIVTMSKTGDTTVLLLRETADSSGYFRHDTGILMDSASLPIDANLPLEGFFGDTFTVVYSDAVTSSDSATAIVRIFPDSAPSGFFTVTLLNATTGTALTSFTIGDTLFIKVALASIAGTSFSSTTVDTFRIFFFSDVTHDSELVILTETDSSSKLFTNFSNSGSTPGPLTTALTDGSITVGDGLLELSSFGSSAFGAQSVSAASQVGGQAVVRAQASTADTLGAYSPDLPGFSFGGLTVVGGQITSVAGVVVYPNPYRPHSGNSQQGQDFSAGNFATGMLWGNMPATWRLRIFSIDGRLVASRSSQTENARGRIQGGTLYQFDVKNDFGSNMASGIYLYSLETPVGNRTGKFAVVR